MRVMLKVVAAISPLSPISGDIRRFTKAKRIPVPGKRRSNHHPRYYTFPPSSDEFIFCCYQVLSLIFGVDGTESLIMISYFPDGILADLFFGCVPCTTVPWRLIPLLCWCRLRPALVDWYPLIFFIKVLLLLFLFLRKDMTYDPTKLGRYDSSSFF